MLSLEYRTAPVIMPVQCVRDRRMRRRPRSCSTCVVRGSSAGAGQVGARRRRKTNDFSANRQKIAELAQFDSQVQSLPSTPAAIELSVDSWWTSFLPATGPTVLLIALNLYRLYSTALRRVDLPYCLSTGYRYTVLDLDLLIVCVHYVSQVSSR